MASPDPPSRESFLFAARRAFSFLAASGFVEVSPPTSHAGTGFELWYRAGTRFVVLEGNGQGKGATVLLATADRRGTSYHRYVPAAERSLAQWNNDQLAIVRAIADKVAAYAQDFLGGALSEYENLAQALPPYRRLPGDA